jgi:hypothetical protein
MGASKRRSCPSVELALLIAGAWWSSRTGAGEELVVAAAASNMSFREGRSWFSLLL